MLAVLVAIAALGTPTPFHQRPVLEPAATGIAGKPIAVLCASSDRRYWAYVTSARPSGRELVTAWAGRRKIFMMASKCKSLERAAGAPSAAPTWQLADAVLTFTQVAIGASKAERYDRRAVNCAALRKASAVASRYFHLQRQDVARFARLAAQLDPLRSASQRCQDPKPPPR